MFADCDMEKAALSERGARAQAEVGARRGQVDTISTRLSSLARLHKTLVSIEICYKEILYMMLYFVGQ